METLRVEVMVETTPTSILTRDALPSGVVACADGVMRPLGPLLGVETRRLGEPKAGGPVPVDHYRYTSPCPMPLFLLQGKRVPWGPLFSILKGKAEPGGGLRFGKVLFEASTDKSSETTVACTLTHGTSRQTFEGHSGICSLLFSGDLNRDGIADFLIERMVGDPCLDRALPLSSGLRWKVVGTNTTSCPD